MDRILARRLEREPDFQKKILKLSTDYIQLGQTSVDYWASDYDAAHDILMCYAPLTKDDLEKLDRGHPKRFILPMTATQITTMATFIAQMLFGDAQPHKVEARGPEDEQGAEHVNQLLRWNDEQQAGYLLGYLWIIDTLTYNRGIRYNCWSPIFETQVSSVQIPDEEDIDEETGAPRTYARTTKTKVAVGGFNSIHLVSPYDFYCDPALPLWRFQAGRFSGHRSIISWNDLKLRSELAIDDPAYVLPAAVHELKEKKKSKGGAGAGGLMGGAGATGTGNGPISRTSFERNRSQGNPNQDANSHDPGMVEIHEVYVRLVPAENDLYDGDEPVLFQMLIGNRAVVLAINECPNKHDEFPYCVAEGRPSAYYQFAPGWAMMLKPLQDYIDYLKDRRQTSISRTGGNIFIARPELVNLADFLDPDKDGLIIPVTGEAGSTKLDDIIKQVPVLDMTKDFKGEMADFMTFSEVVTGVNSAMQGQLDDGTTATQFQGTQQMSAGRLASVARLLSVQGLVPETRQFVCNFQQFLTESMSLRFVPRGADMPALFNGQKSLTISSDTIQGRFDYIAHDGSLPGTDARKVAAISRLLEIVPAIPQYFLPAPGNIDARALILSAAKSAGLNIENYQFTAATAAAESKLPGMTPPPPGAPPGAGAPPPPVGALPDLAAAPGPGPGRPALPDMETLPSAAPLQIRPQNV